MQVNLKEIESNFSNINQINAYDLTYNLPSLGIDWY
jgi:hypothetical protein